MFDRKKYEQNTPEFNIVEYLHGKVKEYFEGVQNGDFNDIKNIPDKYTYAHLIGLFHESNNITNGAELFKLLISVSRECGYQNIQKKVQRGERIKVAFMVMSQTEWPAQGVYENLRNDPRFEAYIVGLVDTSKDFEIAKKQYEGNKVYFEGIGAEFRGTINENDELKNWDDLGGIPDILINLKSYWNHVYQPQNLMNLPLYCINFYIPYCFYVADSAVGDYAKRAVYNMDFMNLQYAVFTDSYKNYLGYVNNQLLKGENVIFSGYAKMDYFYQEHTYNKEDIKRLWKIPEETDCDKVKKIIIAPHYSIDKESIINFSTFHKNYAFLLYLAKKYKNVSFIYKPHPQLKDTVVKSGLFDSDKQYEEYMNEWDSLPNAKVVDKGFYLDLFETSDGMIFDSASFMAEYMYVDKPALYLTRKEQRFNGLGQEIYEGLYKADGADYLSIEKFLTDTVVQGKDTMKEKRATVFANNLDYCTTNGMLASDYIYRCICSLLD